MHEFICIIYNYIIFPILYYIILYYIVVCYTILSYYISTVILYYIRASMPNSSRELLVVLSVFVNMHYSHNATCYNALLA